METIKELSGFSGCKIFLMENNIGYFVRKISKSLDYNSRMIKQMQKQKFFYENLQTNNIKTPNVLRNGYINELFYFDMEYVPGISLTRKIETSNLEELKKISVNIIQILEIFSKNTYAENIPLHEKLREKLHDIQKKEDDKQSKIAVKKTIDLIKDNVFLTSTFCHGDLTLENIIFNEQNGSLYLIDFLDSFVEHYWQDVAKLFQDLIGNWYLFRNKDLNRASMEIKTAIITEIILKDFLINNKYIKYHPLLLATTFCRILPYASLDEKSWVVGAIERSINSNLKLKL